MNITKYRHLKDAKTPPDAQDERHVKMICATLIRERPKSLVEIGCARGFSSAAIMEAVHDSGSIREAHFCDPNPSVDLANELLACRPAHSFSSFKIWPIPSRHFTLKPECWLIDGDHNEEALLDYDNAKAAGARIITVHDSNSANTIGNHRGSLIIGEKLKAEATWYFEDKAKRPGEMTDRGLILGFFYDPSQALKEELHRLAQ